MSFLDELGLDEETFSWRDLALCQGTPTNNFYDDYESSPTLPFVVDEMCLSCPVMKQCLEDGIEGKEYGVHGGIYLTNGKPDDSKNSHKTPDVWKTIKERLSE